MKPKHFFLACMFMGWVFISGCGQTDSSISSGSRTSTSSLAAGLPQPTVEPSPTARPLPQLGILGFEAPALGVKHWFNLPEGMKSFDIGNLRGKVVYLYGFQSWCPGCHRYGFPTLNTLIDYYQGNDEVAFVAVQTAFEGFNTNTLEAAKSTADRYGLTIPVGHSGSPHQRSNMMMNYRSGGTPWTVIIDRDGIVRYNDFHIQPARAIALIKQLL